MALISLSMETAVERDHFMPNPPDPFSNSEVKRHRARLVVRWGTTREVLVLRSLFLTFSCLYVLLFGSVAHMVERVLCMHEAMGSMPISSTMQRVSGLGVERNRREMLEWS